MRIRTISALLLLMALAFAPQVLSAQSGTSGLVQAELAYDNNRYAECWTEVHKALAGKLGARNRIKAHRFRLLCANRLSMRPESMPSGLTKQVLADSATASMQWLVQNLQQEPDLVVSAALEEGYRLNQMQAVELLNSPKAQGSAYLRSARQLEAWTPYQAGNFQHHYFIGQSYQLGKAYNKAIEAYAGAIRAYSASPPETPDVVVARSCYNLAFITVYYLEESQQGNGQTSQVALQQGLDWINQGLRFCTTERQRWAERGGTAEDLRGSDFDAIENDLERLRLDGYLRMQPTPPEAMPAFKTALAADPGNATLHAAYGSLLESAGDVVGAKEAYQEAALLDPTNTNHWFNLGVVDFNEAVQLLKEANALEDLEAALVVQQDALRLMRQAKKPFDKAVDADPQNRGALQVLLQIASLTDDVEGMKRYKEMLNR